MKTDVKKLKASTIAKSMVTRACNPKHLLQAAKLQRNRKRDRRTYDDAQLKFYAEILPADFLHFGYFDDIDTRPENMSLNAMLEGQRRYAEVVLDQVADHRNPVLDVGCGMGGLSAMLMERGFCPVALTPDRLQVSYIRGKYPSVSIIASKFEDLCPKEHAGRYGTVLTAESLQYLKLDRAMPLMAQILRPGGRWIACDFFYRKPSREKSCHNWDEFSDQLSRAGWRVSYQKEITHNVLPTLKFAHMWAVRFGVPLMNFAFLKFRKKQPGLHYLFQTVLSGVEAAAANGIHSIDPEQFVEKHRYMLLKIEREPSQTASTDEVDPGAGAR